MTPSLQQFLQRYLGVGHFLLTQRHQSQRVLLWLLAQVFSCEDILSCSHMGSFETSLGLLVWGSLRAHQALTAASRVLFPSLLSATADRKVSAWLKGQASHLQGPTEHAV